VGAFARHGVAIETVRFAAGTKTAEQAAAAVGAEVGEIVKSLVFEAGGRLVLALCPGDRRVDPRRLAAACGAATAVRADPDRVRRETGFAIGGIPPAGHVAPLATFADPGLLRHEWVWAAAGTPESVFRVRSVDLLRVTGAAIAELTG
jgi:prolyl-tRNA editing enzyme YbaK/EbsC (Cys-tRNA(Pro) deacylase)